jgi:hypothetical protein
MTEPVFDKQDQLDTITSGLLPGEEVLAVYDAIGVGTGFLAITSLRVVLQDNSFVGKRYALTSLPFHAIHSVSFISNRSFLGRFISTGAIALSTSGHDHEVEFRGDEKARHAHDAILSRIVQHA